MRVIDVISERMDYDALVRVKPTSHRYQKRTMRSSDGRSTDAIEILSKYTRRLREMVIADFDRKMKLLKTIPSEDNSEFPDENRTPNVPKPSKPAVSDTPVARPKRVRSTKKASPEGVHIPREVHSVKATPQSASDNKRIRKPARVIREQLEQEDDRLYTPSPSVEGEERTEKKKKSSLRRAHSPAEGRKRIRMNYTDEQLMILRNAFEDDSYASREMKDELAEMTGLSFIQVNKWFENRRKRDRDEASAAKKAKRS